MDTKEIIARENSRRGIASAYAIAIHDLNSGDLKRPVRLAGTGVRSYTPSKRRIDTKTRQSILSMGIAMGYIK